MKTLKKWGPTLAPVLMLVLSLAVPSVQAYVAHTVAPAFAHLAVTHPEAMGAIATVIVAIYHALPSPMQK